MTQKKFAFTNRNLHALAAHDPKSPSKATEYSDATVAGLKMIVGTGSTNAPWHFENEQGQLVGMDITMGRILANTPNVERVADKRGAGLFRLRR